MIVPYYGEFTASPVPLELSLNFCSHRCAFCFANLSSPKRKANMKAIMGLLSGYRDRKTLEALLLREGYPVLISNRVDPFAHSNCHAILPLLEVMQQLGIPVAFQTRGGKCIDEALQLVGPSCWYVSFNTLDDDLAARLEPGAPRPTDRLHLVNKLREAGHRVVCGFNPAVPEWQPDPSELLQSVAAAGAEGVWIEAFHLNRRQVAALSDRDRAILGDDLIARAQQRKCHQPTRDYLDAAEQAAGEFGLPVYRMGNFRRSDFWAPYLETYDRLFPTAQEFINALHDHGEGPVCFDEWLGFMLPKLPAGKDLPVDGYIGSIARNVLRDKGLRVPWHEGPYKVPPRTSYAEVLAMFWVEHRIRLAPVCSAAFSFMCDDKAAPIVDDTGMPILWFHPEGTAEWWQTVVVEEAA